MSDNLKQRLLIHKEAALSHDRVWFPVLSAVSALNAADASLPLRQRVWEALQPMEEVSGFALHHALRMTRRPSQEELSVMEPISETFIRFAGEVEYASIHEDPIAAHRFSAIQAAKLAAIAFMERGMPFYRSYLESAIINTKSIAIFLIQDKED